MGKILLLIGFLFILAGVLLILSPKILGLRLGGHLPGDLFIKKEEMSFYFPVVSCIILSILLNLIFWLFQFFKNK